MTAGLRVIGYCRVSTQEQGDSGAGLAAQRAAIEAACALRGWQLVRIEEDVASGGRTNGRHGLARAVAACEQGEADAIVASKLDRLSRSVGDFDRMLQKARQGGYEVVTLQPDIDTSSPYGKAMAQMVSVFAELERELIAERTRDALAVKRAQGVDLGRPRTLPDAVRRRILRLRRGGKSFAVIADKLNAEGVPTATANAKPGARWHPASVRAAYLAAERDAGKPRTRTRKGAAK